MVANAVLEVATVIVTAVEVEVVTWNPVALSVEVELGDNNAHEVEDAVLSALRVLQVVRPFELVQALSPSGNPPAPN